jgi:hypothetical protein
VIKTLRSNNVNKMIPVERIAQKIYLIRGQRVMLDYDLAEFYGVETKVLNQAIKRNLERFPGDFMLKLTREESINLRSQFVTSSLDANNLRHGGRRYSPYAFTEHGVVMLSSILKSKQAISVSIIVVKAFVKLRRLAEDAKEASSKINEHHIKLLPHDKKLEEHENSINVIVGHIIGSSKRKKKEKKYGFKIDENNNIVKEEQYVAVYC